jgi:hypothetical protein
MTYSTKTPAELATEIAVKALQLTNPGTAFVHSGITDITHMAVAYREQLDAMKVDTDAQRAALIVQWMKTSDMDVAKISGTLEEAKMLLDQYTSKAADLRAAHTHWFNDNVRVKAVENLRSLVNSNIAAIKREIQLGEKDLLVAKELPAWKNVPAAGIEAMLALAAKPAGFETLLEGFQRAYIGSANTNALEKMAWVEYIPELMNFVKGA